MQRISAFLEDHAPSIVVLTFLLAVGAYVTMTGLFSPSSNPRNTAQVLPAPTASLTEQGFPAPGTTLTLSHHVRRKDGSIATRTIREYLDSENRIIRETVREPAPGVRVTSTQTIVAAGPASTVMSTARETVLTRETITGPGGTVTVEVPVPVTVTGPESTTTATATETVSVPGPETTTTQTLTETSTETVTVTVPPPPSP